MPPKSPLQTAIKGGPVTDRQAKSALGDAVKRIASLSRRAKASKEAMLETGTMVVHTAETQGSLFLASMAEGYLGEDKLKIGNVDVRAPLGLAAQGYGLYEAMSGGSNGGHALAIGNGVLGSFLASVAIKAGQTLAEKRSAKPAPVPEPVAAPTLIHGPSNFLPAAPLMPEPDIQGPMREVLLTPEADDIEGWPPPRRRRRRRPFRRRRRPQPLADFDEDDPTEELDPE
jgi:hypothetical protein